MPEKVKHPEVKVQLTGEDGNAFAIIGRVQRAMKEAGVSSEEIKQFVEEAMSEDFDNLIETCLRWVDAS